MKNLTGIGLAAWVAVALIGTPRASRAGDKEWATAGKILTGVVALHTLTEVWGADDGGAASRRVSWRNRGYDRSYGVAAPRSYTYRRSYWRPTYRRSRQHGDGCCAAVERPVVIDRGGCSTPPRRDPIIVYKGDGTRLYQAPYRGATAYLQIYSEVSDRWVNIKACPSIW